MNAGNSWEQEYNRPNGLGVEKAPKSDLYLYLFTACWLLQLRQSAVNLDIEQVENVTGKSLITVS